MKIAKVLLVEDNNSGSMIVDRLKREGFAVCWPRDPESLAHCVATETFDAVIADERLNEGDWSGFQNGKKILGTVVRNGNDLGRLLKRFRVDSPQKSYTTKRNKLTRETVNIKKPIKPDDVELKTALSVFGNDTRKYVRSIGPWVLKYEDFNKLTSNERIKMYKKALNLNAKWLKVALREMGNVTWILLADKKVRLCGHSLDSNDANPLHLPQAAYPTQEAISRVGRQTKTFPYPIWNINKLEYLDTQFALAGPGLSKFTPMVQDLFSISVANTCADAFIKDSNLNISKWSSKLTVAGKVQLSKSVFKSLAAGGHKAFSRFVRNTERFTLPKIVEIYEATVDRIDPKKAAWIEFRKVGHDRISMVEPFDLGVLQKNGVKVEHQKFEYTVYSWADGDIGMNIELAQENEQPLFSFLD